MKQRIISVLIMTVLAVVPAYSDTLTVAVIRVAFPMDDSPATAGDGQFIMNDESGVVCSQWVLDPPPHNKQYFEDHLKAAHNYWARVSGGAVGIDTLNSRVFPDHPDSAFTLPHDMLYYRPYLEEFDETAKLMEFARHSIQLSDPYINFNDFTTVMIVHAGMGGDFAFALDPTPGNIPSAFLAEADFSEYGSLQTGEGDLDDLIIIPESQNFMQYDETRSLFEDASDPCFYQVGLNGTIALMLGYHLGLPPMYNTESGQSLLGGFALMDQGSNNWHGIVPAYPNPYTRILEGWTNSVTKTIGDDVDLHVDDPPVKISISADEYYLLENRQRNLSDPAHMTTWIDTLGGDTVSVITAPSGVVIEVDEQHAGLPGNGLYIWHVNEAAEYTEGNPNGGTYQLVDFIEADGAQDMGHETQLIFADFLETGWWFDAWYADNEGWFDLNRSQDTAIHFSSQSFPATKTSEGIDTYLRIENISANGSTMSFSIRSDRIINNSFSSEIFGWGLTPGALYGLSADGLTIESYMIRNQEVQSLGPVNLSADSVFIANPDSSYSFRYPWIASKKSSGIQIYSLIDQSSYTLSNVDSIFELRLGPDSLDLQFFARQAGEYRNTLIADGLMSQTNISGYPLSDFGDVNHPILVGSTQAKIPKPFSVLNSTISGADRVVVSWDETGSEPAILGSRSGSTIFSIFASDFKYMIPVDPDQNGEVDIALVSEDQVRIVNQAGVNWNGSQFSIDRYYGNPIIAPFIDGKPEIFLRHESAYSIYSLEGQLLDTGLLPRISGEVENRAHLAGETTYVLSATDLLYFSGQEDTSKDGLWLEEQGNALGTRTLSFADHLDPNTTSDAKHSVYNYPNPVKGQSTTIRAWLGNMDQWSIEIFSVNGSQLEYIELDVHQKYAYNEWVWDASEVSNGVYIAHVVAGDLSEIIKIAVIR